MKWFFKWLDTKCKKAWESSQNEGAEESKYASVGLATGRPSRRNTLSVKGDDSLHSRGTSFTLYNANGGTVVELRDYDPANDRHNNVLYVIPSDQDLGEQLGHIVTMEALKR
jgi:hypothetical protein